VDIGFGGSVKDPVAFAVGCEKTENGYKVYQVDIKTMVWSLVPGQGGIQITVDSAGNPWILNDSK